MLHVPRPLSIDPLIAEAKRRARIRQLLVVTAVLVITGGVAGATIALRSASGGIGDRAGHRYTFRVEAVNSSRLVHAVKYVSIVSPVALSRGKLIRTPLFDMTGEFRLVRKPARGSVVCSFTSKVAGSTTFPNANGKTVAVKVYGQEAPDLTTRICKAFETFSLSWVHESGRSDHRLSPFNGIRAARHARTGADLLPSRVLARIEQLNAQSAGASQPGLEPARLLPHTARVLGKASDGSVLYGLADTRGDLCTFSDAGGSCAPPLSKTHPITMVMANAAPTTGGTFVVSGVAIDGVDSVSFTVWGKAVTVPVTHNVYVYERPHSTAHQAECAVAHFADGSTVDAFPDVGCRAAGTG